MALIPPERFEHAILLLRGQTANDADSAALYAVKTKQGIRAVKRNIDRFPGDIAFDAYAARVYELEVPNWHLKFVGRPADAALGVYRPMSNCRPQKAPAYARQLGWAANDFVPRPWVSD